MQVEEAPGQKRNRDASFSNPGRRRFFKKLAICSSLVLSSTVATGGMRIFGHDSLAEVSSKAKFSLINKAHAQIDLTPAPWGSFLISQRFGIEMRSTAANSDALANFDIFTVPLSIPQNGAAVIDYWDIAPLGSSDGGGSARKVPLLMTRRNAAGTGIERVWPVRISASGTPIFEPELAVDFEARPIAAAPRNLIDGSWNFYGYPVVTVNPVDERRYLVGFYFKRESLESGWTYIPTPGGVTPDMDLQVPVVIAGEVKYFSIGRVEATVADIVARSEGTGSRFRVARQHLAGGFLASDTRPIAVNIDSFNEALNAVVASESSDALSNFYVAYAASLSALPTTEIAQFTAPEASDPETNNDLPIAATTILQRADGEAPQARDDLPIAVTTTIQGADGETPRAPDDVPIAVTTTIQGVDGGATEARDDVQTPTTTAIQGVDGEATEAAGDIQSPTTTAIQGVDGEATQAPDDRAGTTTSSPILEVPEIRGAINGQVNSQVASGSKIARVLRGRLSSFRLRNRPGVGKLANGRARERGVYVKH